MVNRITETTKVRTTPKRPISQPVSGTVTPLATAKAVITQVELSELTPRLPAMVVSETFAMVVSSTCMKVPSASATAAAPRATPASGAGPSACAAAALTGPRPDERWRHGWRR
jgi:hypothetical protein